MLIRLLLFISLFVSFLAKAQTMYWVGGSGYWNEANHWSYTSGGNPAGTIPTANTNVVFDNSSAAVDFTVHALTNIYVKSISALNNLFRANVIGAQNIDLKLSGNTDLNEYFNLKISGKLFIQPTRSARFNFAQNKFENDVFVASNFPLDLRLLRTTKTVNLSGNFRLENSTIISENLVVNSASVDLKQNILQISNNITLNSSSFTNQTNSSNKIICNKVLLQSNTLSALSSIPNTTLKQLIPTACNPTLVTFAKPTCAGACDGYAVFNLSGCSNPPYSTTWIPDPTTPCASYPPADFGIMVTTYTVNNICGCGTDFTVLFENNIGEQGVVIISGLTNPSATLLTFTSSQPSCNGQTNGQIRLNVLSGALPLVINWNPSATTHSNVITKDTLKNVGAGTYTVTATNNNGCVSTFTTILNQPTIITPAGNSNSITCNNVCNGSAGVNPTGGNAGGYTYNWSGAPTGQGTNNVTNLCPGVITVTVSDTKSCTATYSTNITQPPAITLTVTKTNLICGNICDGTASVTATGGVGGFTYTLQTPTGSITTSPPYSNLCAGTYTLVALNNGNCTKTSTFVITSPPTLTATPTQTNLTCNAVCTGSINLNPSGGTGALTYVWSPSVSSSSVANNVCAGVYNYTITDNVNCTYTNSVTITQPLAVSLSVTKTDVTCFGLCNGTGIANISGGTSPYTYTWSPSTPTITGQGSSSVSNLCQGSYTLNTKDFNGCPSTTTFSITEPTDITPNTSFVSPTCNNTCNGTINAAPTGGNGAPYTYTLQTPSAGAITSSPPFTGLCAGTHTLLIKDAGGCIKTKTITLVNPNPLLLTLNPTNLNCFGICNGSIASIVSGGTPSYTVSWSVGGTGGTKSGLCAGIYTASNTISCKYCYNCSKLFWSMHWYCYGKCKWRNSKLYSNLE